MSRWKFNGISFLSHLHTPYISLRCLYSFLIFISFPPFSYILSDRLYFSSYLHSSPLTSSLFFTLERVRVVYDVSCLFNDAFSSSGYRIPSRHLLRGTEKNHGNFSQDNWCQGRVSNQEPPEYKPDASPHQLTCSVWTFTTLKTTSRFKITSEFFSRHAIKHNSKQIADQSRDSMVTV
jgi:hypothetical protein